MQVKINKFSILLRTKYSEFYLAILVSGLTRPVFFHEEAINSLLWNLEHPFSYDVRIDKKPSSNEIINLPTLLRLIPHKSRFILSKLIYGPEIESVIKQARRFIRLPATARHKKGHPKPHSKLGEGIIPSYDFKDLYK